MPLQKKTTLYQEKGLLILKVNEDIEFVELCLFKWSRSIDHDITTRVVLREGNTVTDAVKTCKEAHEAVETVGQSTMRRSTILEGVEQVHRYSGKWFYCLMD